jgi:hypothetical protein
VVWFERLSHERPQDDQRREHVPAKSHAFFRKQQLQPLF